MELIVRIPDDLIEPIKRQLASQPSGILETVALDAVIGFLMRFDPDEPTSSSPR